MASSFRSEKWKAEKGNTERLCSNIAFLDIPRVDRCQLKGKVNIIGFFKITSCFGFRRAHPDSHAAVVAQLSAPSPPKSALGAAFACVEISPSVAINLGNKPLYSRGQRVKAGEQPCKTFVWTFLWMNMEVFDSEQVWSWWDCSKSRHSDVSSLLGSLPLPWIMSESLLFILEKNVPLAEPAAEQESFENHPVSFALCGYLHRRCGPCCLVAHVWLHTAIISIMGSKHRGKLLTLLLSSHPTLFLTAALYHFI